MIRFRSRMTARTIERTNDDKLPNFRAVYHPLEWLNTAAIGRCLHGECYRCHDRTQIPLWMVHRYDHFNIDRRV